VEFFCVCKNERHRTETYLICIDSLRLVKLQVLTAASMKVTAFSDISSCSLFEVDYPDDRDSTHL
jgi:hypothetical protein